jgi:hypothetical protein
MSESQQQHNDDNGPAYDPNIPSFDNVQTVKCTECLLQWLVVMMTIQQSTGPTGIFVR